MYGTSFKRPSLESLPCRYAMSLAVAAGAFLIAFAACADVPPCMDQNLNAMPINNEIVLKWKESTPNNFVRRAHIKGIVIPNDAVSDRNSHSHFVIAILGTTQSGPIEVVYSDQFGLLPAIHEGMQVEACGDYITSTGRGGPDNEFPPSPVGAIIHWLHKSWQPLDRHPSGFLAIDGVVYGYGDNYREGR